MPWQQAYPAVSGMECALCERIRLYWTYDYTIEQMIYLEHQKEIAHEFAEDSG